MKKITEIDLMVAMLRFYCKLTKNKNPNIKTLKMFGRKKILSNEFFFNPQDFINFLAPTFGNLSQSNRTTMFSVIQGCYKKNGTFSTLFSRLWEYYQLIAKMN